MYTKLNTSNGFTIVETLIVLAVTGVLFLSTSLMISGQTERYRYRDSMYQLQQQVQNQINSVQTGQFSESIRTSDTVYLGKKILFCNSTATSNACIATKPSETQHKNVLVKQTGGSDTVHEADDIVSNPGNIKFTKAVKSNGDIYGDQFGVSILFTNIKASSENSGSLNVALYNYNAINKISDYNKLQDMDSGGFVLCFEGQKKGSLELGSKDSGSTVKLNLEDSRCN